MRASRFGEWPFVAGLLVAIALFVLAEPLNAEGGSTDVAMRPSTEDARDPSAGGIGQAHVEYVDGVSEETRWGDHSFRLSGSSHSPTVGERWGVVAVASDGDEPFAGEVRIDVMMDSAVVRHVRTAKVEDGTHAESWVWPAQAAGAKFTIRVTLDAGEISQTFLYPVQVVGRN
jgi:hypothetical protein